MKLRIIFLLTLAFTICACSEFEDMNKDTNKPEKVTPEMLATTQIYEVFNNGSGSNSTDNNYGENTLSADKRFIYHLALSKHIAWWEMEVDEVYNKLGTYRISYLVYTNTDKMLELAESNDLDAYTGLSYFLRTNKVFETTMRLGDVPYSEAGKGAEGLITPKYDEQKNIMLGLLDDIDLAYQHFDKATRSFKGDIVYGGNIEKWKKVCAALELKILIQLSKKENDPDLKIKERFSKVLNDKILMDSNSDNFQLMFEDKAGMYYPFSALVSKQQAYAMVSSVVVDPLKKYDDPRLFTFAEPAAALIKQGLSADDKNAYIGIDPSLNINAVQDAQKKEMFSLVGEHFRSKDEPVGEPYFRFSYAEQCFIIAEAAARGWIDKSKASEYFKKGIEAAMSFTAKYTLEKHTHGHPITTEDIERVKNHPDLQLTGNLESDLEKIITQKYLASFFQNYYNAYYDYRRTGYPVFPIDPISSMNDDGFKEMVPTRWRYSGDEYSSNMENMEEALQRQYNGLDRNNDLMWILKE